MKPCNHDEFVEGCRICFLAVTDKRYQSLWDIGNPSPSIAEKAISFGKAIWGYAQSGFKNVTDNEFSRRWSLCEACPQKDGDSCKLCGCYLPLKVKMESMKCPLNKW